MLSHHFLEEAYGLLTLKFEGKLDSRLLLQASNEVHFLPLARDVYLFAEHPNPAVVCLIGLSNDAAEELFGEIDHIPIIGIGAVQFA
jgi:hypothetical protein